MKLARKLTLLRTQQRLTQESISKTLCITRSSYAKYEVGENNPNFETLIKIANYYHVSTDYLLDSQDHRINVYHENKENYNHYKLIINTAERISDFYNEFKNN